MVPPPHASEALLDAMGAAVSALLPFETKHLPPERTRASKSAQQSPSQLCVALTSVDTARTAGSMAVVSIDYSLRWSLEALLSHLKLISECRHPLRHVLC